MVQSKRQASRADDSGVSIRQDRLACQRMGGIVSDLVVGSGPTAFAAALGVAARGGQPVLLDFGKGIAGARAGLVGTSALAVKTDNGRGGAFAYPTSLVVAEDGGHLPLSSARGGLSRIWGAGVLMRDDEELAQFGPAEQGVRDGYLAVMAAIPTVGRVDATSERFPWPGEHPTAPQSRRFARLAQLLQAPAQDGVLFGFPRVALDLRNLPGCLRCGQCLSGCPEHLFFNSGRELEGMSAAGVVSWLPGPAMSISCHRGGAEVSTPRGPVRAKRVYLAAGPVATTALLQRSGLLERDMELEDSAVFYTAFLNTSKPGDDVYDYAASQLVAFSDHPGPDDFQLAIYEANPEYRARARELLRVVPAGLVPDAMLKRVNAGIGFLAPEVSGRLVIRTVSKGRTWVGRRTNRSTRDAARSVVARTGPRLRLHGLRPVPGAVVVPPPGSGYHVGAGMPVGGSVLDYEGRLRKASAIHVVDASSLPHVWAGSHTLTAMANAYRIALGHP